MTHTVHPYSHRLGILRDWKSRWFSPKGKYKYALRGDILIRQYLKNKLLEEKVDVKLDIKEVKSAESNAAIVSQMIVEGLEKRLPFRRLMKQMLEKVMANRDVLGVRIFLAGRLGGATMSRTEDRKLGRIPLQTLRADVDYASTKAVMPYGTIGVKVWIYKGDIFADKHK